MGVTISCTKTGRTIDMGSGGFLRLRSKISELVGEPWASHYRALVEERICGQCNPTAKAGGLWCEPRA